jgi:hypothetical protein
MSQSAMCERSQCFGEDVGKVLVVPGVKMSRRLGRKKSTREMMSQSTMSRCCQRLSEDVGRVLDALDVEQLEVLLGDPVSIRVELHIRRSPPER